MRTLTERQLWYGIDKQVPETRELRAGHVTDFRYNRTGLCILHPFRESAGRPYRAQTPQGDVSGSLPVEI